MLIGGVWRVLVKIGNLDTSLQLVTRQSEDLHNRVERLENAFFTQKGEA